MLRVNLSARTDVMAISLHYFSCPANPLLILKAHSDHGRMHNSYYLVVRHVRYSRDLEGLQEKAGRTGLCYSLFPEGEKEGSVLDEAVTYFLEESLFSKKEKRTHFIINRACESSCAWNSAKFIMNASGKKGRLLLLLVP